MSSLPRLEAERLPDEGEIKHLIHDGARGPTRTRFLRDGFDAEFARGVLVMHAKVLAQTGTLGLPNYLCQSVPLSA